MRHEKIAKKIRRRAFTLVEMMVSLAIFLVLMTVILVPVKMGLDSFALSRAKAQTQSSLGVSVSQIENDLRRAVRVFPNSGARSIYLRSGTVNNLADLDACDTANNERFSNPARLDMILMARDASGNTISPASPSGTIVTYYARRADPSKPYSFSENPLLLYRAETPFRVQTNSGSLGGVFKSPTDPTTADNATIAPIDPAIACANATDDTRARKWRMHSREGESNLEPFTRDAGNAGVAFGSHQVAIPSDLALVAPNAYVQEDASAFSTAPRLPLIPETTFSTFDTNGDGKTDRVAINLSAQSFSAQNANLFRNNRPSGVSLRVVRTVDLPNIQ